MKNHQGESLLIKCQSAANKQSSMKIPAFKKTRGFTLIEILIAISILALLAASSWQAIAWVRARSMQKECEMQIGLIETGLNSYKSDHSGLLPYATGDDWSAHVIYQALSGDMDNDGKTDKDEDGLLRERYCESLIAVEDSNSKETAQGLLAFKVKLKRSKSTPSKQRRGKLYAILDPWSNPYRYRLGCEAESEGRRRGHGINSDFDIYSQGPDVSGNGKSKEGDNADNISNIQFL